MALGGGTFIAQNKLLPGTYINFMSLSAASATLSDRGIVAMAFDLDWGPSGEVFEVTNEDFQTNAQKYFGYDASHSKMKGLRDLFLNTRTLYAYRLNAGGAKAVNEYAAAKHAGVRGNDLKIVIQVNADDLSKKDIKLYLGNSCIDEQTVTTSAELRDNDYVVYVKDADLIITAGTPFTGGTNGSSLTTADYQGFLNKIQAYTFNAIGVVSELPEVNQLVASFCMRMRDELGMKFQAVVYNTAADHEGVINVKNTTTDEGYSPASLVYWVTGIAAGCEVNKTNLNKVYNGEFTVNVDYTQTQLETAIKSGEFNLHRVGSDIRVLADINSLLTVSDDKNELFQDNQTIRVIDQVANDIAVLFNTKYLGSVPNDESGRISLWADIVKHHQQLQDIRAIENFSDADVTVSQGTNKKSVVVADKITIVNAMAQLYMQVTVA